MTFSNKQDNEIHSKRPDSSNSRPKRSSEHACLVLFSSFCVIEGAGVKCGVYCHQVIVKSLSNKMNLYSSGLQPKFKSVRQINLGSSGLRPTVLLKAKRSSEHACLSLAKSSSLSSSTFQLVVASVNQISKAKSIKKSVAS